MKKTRFGTAIGVVLIAMTAGCAAPATPAPAPAATGRAPHRTGHCRGLYAGAVCSVPNVVGLDRGMAQGLLAKLGLQPVLSNQYDAGIAEGAVISQKPVVGARMEPCRGDVEIVVSLGPIPTLTPRPATATPLPTDTPAATVTPAETPTPFPAPARRLVTASSMITSQTGSSLSGISAEAMSVRSMTNWSSRELPRPH